MNVSLVSTMSFEWIGQKPSNCSNCWCCLLDARTGCVFVPCGWNFPLLIINISLKLIYWNFTNKCTLVSKPIRISAQLFHKFCIQYNIFLTCCFPLLTTMALACVILLTFADRESAEQGILNLTANVNMSPFFSSCLENRKEFQFLSYMSQCMKREKVVSRYSIVNKWPTYVFIWFRNYFLPSKITRNALRITLWTAR